MARERVTNYRVYICGPIAGYEDLNRKAFQEAEDDIRKRGLYPVSPHKTPPRTHAGPCPGAGRDYAHKDSAAHASYCYMRGDIAVLVECDAIYVLNGWELSVGGRLELAIATQCGLDVYFQDHRTLPWGKVSDG